MKRKPLSKYGDLFTHDEWKKIRGSLCFPSDGFGRWATGSEEFVFEGSDVFNDMTKPEEATHVMWFNK